MSNFKPFNDIVEDRFYTCKRVLIKKSDEYSSDEDRYHNFRVAAAIDNETPERALWGMFKKHLVSMKDLVDHPEKATLELIDEKLGDVINYTVLLEGLLAERIECRELSNERRALQFGVDTKRLIKEDKKK